MKNFVKQYVKDGDDLKIFVMGIVLIVAAIGVAIYDVVTIVLGTVNPNVHIPFVLAAGLGAIGGICLAILRHGARCPECTENRGRWSHGAGKDSYQHPDNWPQSRVNAPDGESD